MQSKLIHGGAHVRAPRKSLILLTIIFLGGLLAGGLNAQLTAIVPAGTDQAPPGAPLYANGYPLSTWYYNQRFESIYLESDLVAAGLVGGEEVNAIALRVSSLPGRSVANFRIRMGHTSATQVANFTTSGNLTLVYGPTTIPVSSFTVDDWFTFQLTTPFIWNGTENLVIDFTTNDSNYTAGGSSYVRQAGTNRSRLGYQDGGSYPFDTIGNQSGTSLVPAVRLTYTPGGLSIITGTLPQAGEGIPYSTDIHAINGNLPYTWSHVSGTLPSGLTLSQVGDVYRLSGTPGAGSGGNNYQFTVGVSDGTDNTQRQLNLTVTPPPLTVPYVQDFVANNGFVDGWSTAGAHASLWQWGTPASAGLTSGHIGANAWGTNLTGNYGINNAEAYLISPEINLTGSIQPGVSFFHHVNSENPTYAWDGGTVQLRVNGGTWTSLQDGDPGFLQNGPNTGNVIGNGQPGWHGTPWAGWQETIIDLFQLTSINVSATDTVQVRFWFSTDSSVNTYPGWYIDYFRVRELPARNRLILTDFEIFSPYVLGGNQVPNVYTGTQADFELTVDNVTANPIEVTSFTVLVSRFAMQTSENVGTWDLNLTIPFTVPANTMGHVITGVFDCTSVPSSGSGTQLTVTAILEGVEQNTNVNVETEEQAYLYVSQGPPPPPPQMNVHETDFQGALIDHDDSATGTLRDFGQIAVGQDMTTLPNNGWLNIVIINDTNADFDVSTPTLGGPDATSFQLNTAQFTSHTMTLTPTGTTRQVFFSVRMRPYAIGQLNAWVDFAHTAPNPSTTPFRVNFTGEGTGDAPELQVHESQYTGPKIDNGDTATGTGRDFGTTAPGGFSGWLNIVMWNRFPTDTTINHTPTLSGPDAADFEIFYFANEIQATGPYVMDGTPGLTATTAFSVRFAPQSSSTAGAKQAFITFGHNASNPTGAVLGNGNYEFSFEVIGTVASNDPAIQVSEADAPQGAITASIANGAAAANDRDFGSRDIAAGATAFLTIRVANPGGASMNVGTPTLALGDTGDFQIQTGAPFNFSSPVAAGSYTEFGVAFNPGSIGQKTATVRFTHNGVNTSSPFEFDVTGLGTAQAPELEVREDDAAGPLVGFNASALGTGRDFGSRSVTQGASTPLTIYIENTGNLDMTVGTPVFASGSSSPGDFVLNTTGMANVLTPGNSTTFTVAFHPTSHGPKSALIDFDHNASNEPAPFRIQVAGFGDAPRFVAREGGSTGPDIPHDTAPAGGRDFGSVGLAAMPSAPLTVVVVNTGSALLSVNLPSLTGPHANQFTLDTGGFLTDINPGASSTFLVRFNASQVGLKEAQVNIGHNDNGAPAPYIIRVRGVATDPAGVEITSPASLGSTRIDSDIGQIQLQATGGQQPYVWTLRPGHALPTGLAMTSDGLITGTATGPAGAYDFLMRVSDANGGTDDKLLRIDVLPSAGGGFTGGGGGGGGGGGCAAIGTGPVWLLALVLLALPLAGRRKRTA